MNIKVLIACHKKVEVPRDDLYLPIFVGAYGKEDIGFQRDDEGDNISQQNGYYSELTGLYWAWKNLDVNYLGLCHYRRYFSLQAGEKSIHSVLNKEEAENLLQQYKVIVPKKRNYYIETIYSHYAHTFDETHFLKTRKIIVEKHPDYIATYDSVMHGKFAYMFNMFIMPKELVNQYCAWLFPILEVLIQEIGDMGDAFQNRYVGRVSERLFNVWLFQQIKEGNLKDSDICELPYTYLGKVNYWRKAKGFLSAKFFHKKYKGSF